MTKEMPKERWLHYALRLLLLIPFVAMLWVPSYNTSEPEIAGIPFFYWYQLAWILIGAILVLIVYLLEIRLADRV